MKNRLLSLANKAVKNLDRIATEDGDDTFLSKTNSLIDAFNKMSKGLSLSKNFSSNSSILEVTLAAGETKNISHLLGVRPKYRIILRQEGNGVLSDIPSSWDDTIAVIKNNGAVEVKATIMFLKE